MTTEGTVEHMGTRGDLIVMSPTDNAISAMIQKYDRSPYTHVGIDLGDGSVVNCRTEGELIKAGENGGVRVDVLAEITDRRCFRAPVLLDEAEKDRAATTAWTWREDDGFGDVSAFSFPKMFQCAVAIDASRPEARFHEDDDANAAAVTAMLDAAFAAGEAWRYDPGLPGPASFFCAEMVVEAYGIDVPREFLAPPLEVEPLPVEQDRFSLDQLAQDVIDSWFPDERSRTMAAVVYTVTRHDPEFFGGALKNVLSWLLDSGHQEPDTVRSTTEVVPPALVTPRMLLRCDWVGPVDPTDLSGTPR